MDGCSLIHACEQIISEFLDLHVFVTDQSKIDKHIQTDKQLNNAPGVPVFFDKQKDAQRDGQANVAEIE